MITLLIHGDDRLKKYWSHIVSKNISDSLQYMYVSDVVEIGTVNGWRHFDQALDNDSLVFVISSNDILLLDFNALVSKLSSQSQSAISI